MSDFRKFAKDIADRFGVHVIVPGKSDSYDIILGRPDDPYVKKHPEFRASAFGLMAIVESDYQGSPDKHVNLEKWRKMANTCRFFRRSGVQGNIPVKAAYFVRTPEGDYCCEDWGARWKKWIAPPQ